MAAPGSCYWCPLLKHNADLDEKKNERARLMDALGLNQSLMIAYYLKEDLGQIRQQTGRWCVPCRLVWPRSSIRYSGPADNGLWIPQS